jgi:hypothetical protein
LLQGPLLQLLIIQTQYMKRELLRQMSAMDTLLRQNFFTASMSALLPGALAIGSTLVVLRKLAGKLLFSRRRSRRSLVMQLRTVMRDTERLLLRSLARARSLQAAPPPLPTRPSLKTIPPKTAPADTVGTPAIPLPPPAIPLPLPALPMPGTPALTTAFPRSALSMHAPVSAPDSTGAAVFPTGRPALVRLSEVDTGLLVISLHVLRQTLERHRALLEPGERISLFEDLEDLESEQYDCEGKLQVLQRIYRTQPALLVGGGAAAAGARHFPGMHGIDRR